MRFFIEQYRFFRAVALQNGMDPDKALPEDVLLLAKDKDGNLEIGREYEKAEKALRLYFHMKAQKAKQERTNAKTNATYA